MKNSQIEFLVTPLNQIKGQQPREPIQKLKEMNFISLKEKICRKQLQSLRKKSLLRNLKFIQDLEGREKS